MPLVYRLVFPAMWISWVIYWLWASRYAKPSERREPIGSLMQHAIPLWLAVWLLWGRGVRVTWLNDRLFPWAPWGFWLAALMTVLGLLFAVWARVHLGRNWSSVVTIKEGHELIDTGPYALVSHPIYAGLLVAFIGMGGVLAEASGRRAVDDRTLRGTVHRLLQARSCACACLEVEANVKQARARHSLNGTARRR